jgi:hypothetical protein
MRVSLSNRALLRGLLAGAVVLTGTACSRSDRAETGRDNSAAVLPDTIGNAQSSGSGSVTGSVNDTASGAATDTAAAPDRSSSTAQPSPAAPSNTPRSETAPSNDKDAAGYRPMERDTAVSETPATTSDTLAAEMSASSTDSAAVATAQIDTAATEPAAEIADTTSTEMAGAADTARTGVSADTVAAGYVEMARDTSSAADQADSAATPTGDVALEATVDTSPAANAEVSVETGVATGDVADTTGNADRIRSPEESTEVLGQVTTDSAAGADSPDSTEVVRVRPPEDSTEVLGSVTTTDQAADETADEQIVTPDSATVATSEARTDEVGAAAVGGHVTGAEAVGLMTRAGVRCGVADPEGNEAVRWDMSNTPATLNPCGMGSMILSRIWTEK